jgi:hypothetical protein
MPYQQDKANFAIRVSVALQDSEIREDIDEAGANEDDLRLVLDNTLADTWTAAASEIDEYNKSEKAFQLETLKLQRTTSQLKIWRVALVFGIPLLLVAGGWLFFSDLSRRLTVAIGLPLLLTFAGIITRFLQLRRTKNDIQSAQVSNTSDLAVRLSRTHAAVENGLKPSIRSYLSSLRTDTYGTDLPQKATSGLAETEGSQFEISTQARERTIRLIDSMQSASLGISGPRGAGKTTLLWSICQAGKTNQEVLSLFTSAPVLYDSRDFLLYLFASLCGRVFEKETGVPPARSWRRFDDLKKESPIGRVIDPQVFASAAFLLSALLLYVGLAFGQWTLLRSYDQMRFDRALSASDAAVSRTNQSQSQSTSALVANYTQLIGVSPGTMVLTGTILFCLAWIVNASQPQPLRFRELWFFAFRRRRKTTEPADSAHGPQLSDLVKEAGEILKALRVQQTYSSGWSGALKLPGGFESSATSTVTWAEKQLTLPELVDEYRSFLGKVSKQYKHIIVAIDELDKLASDELAEQFLNGIKAIFGQPKVYYLVSVSQNAMSGFERRGLPFRDVFDSSFDDILYLDYLDLDASRRVIGRRVVGLPHPFVCFCHCMSGGLPRDLIRQCRSVFDCGRAHLQGTDNLMGISRVLVLAEIRAKVNAISIAAQKLSLEQEVSVFLGMLSRKDTWNDASWLDTLRGLQRNQETIRERLNDQVPATDDRRKLAGLYDEAITYLSFLLTIYELFSMKMSEPIWVECRQNDVFNRLGQIRQLMSINRATAMLNLNEIRRGLGLATIQGADRDVRGPDEEKKALTVAKVSAG